MYSRRERVELDATPWTDTSSRAHATANTCITHRCAMLASLPARRGYASLLVVALVGLLRATRREAPPGGKGYRTLRTHTAPEEESLRAAPEEDGQPA